MRAAESLDLPEIPGLRPWVWTVWLLAPAVAFWGSAHLGLGLAAPTPTRLLMSLLVAPLVEEWVMRQLLQRELLAWGRARGVAGWPADGLAAIFTTLGFALIHLPQASPAGLLACSPRLLPGAALALVWCWRRRWQDSALSHAYFNLLLWLIGALAS